MWTSVCFVHGQKSEVNVKHQKIRQLSEQNKQATIMNAQLQATIIIV